MLPFFFPLFISQFFNISFFFFMSFLWNLTFTFYLLPFNHSLFLAVLPLRLTLLIPFLPLLPPFPLANIFLSPTPFSQPTTKYPSGIPQTSSFRFALPSGTEFCIHPSDRLLFLTCTLPLHHPSISKTWLTGFYPREQLLTSDFRFLRGNLLSTSVSFSRSPATISERLQKSL